MPKHKHLNRAMELRQLTGISQEELAAMLDTSRSSLAMHELTGRDLPGHASLYYAYVLMEMNKPENQSLIAPAAISESARQKLKKKLLSIVQEKRYEAETLQRMITAYESKEAARRNRQLLSHCVEKAQALLIEQAQGTAWSVITERHKEWLDMEKSFTSYLRCNETAFIQNELNRLRYNTLVREAEEAERMVGELDY